MQRNASSDLPPEESLPVRKLSNQASQALRELLSRRVSTVQLKNIMELLVPQILDGYDYFRADSKKLSLAESRESLKVAKSAGCRLLKALRGVSFGAKEVLDNQERSKLDRAENSVLEVIEVIEKAEHRLSFHRNGRVRDAARSHLANMTALMIQQELGDRPSTSGDGLYQKLLAVILREATGAQVREVRELARRGVKWFNSVDGSFS